MLKKKPNITIGSVVQNIYSGLEYEVLDIKDGVVKVRDTKLHNEYCMAATDLVVKENKDVLSARQARKRPPLQVGDESPVQPRYSFTRTYDCF